MSVATPTPPNYRMNRNHISKLTKRDDSTTTELKNGQEPHKQAYDGSVTTPPPPNQRMDRNHPSKLTMGLGCGLLGWPLANDIVRENVSGRRCGRAARSPKHILLCGAMRPQTICFDAIQLGGNGTGGRSNSYWKVTLVGSDCADIVICVCAVLMSVTVLFEVCFRHGPPSISHSRVNPVTLTHGNEVRRNKRLHCLHPC